MWESSWKPWVILVASAAIVLAGLYIAYRWVDPLPPHRLAIAEIGRANV